MKIIKTIPILLLITSSIYAKNYDIFGYDLELPELPFKIEQSLNVEIVSNFEQDEKDNVFLFTHEIGYEISTKDQNNLIYGLELNIGNHKNIYYMENNFKLGYDFKNFTKLDPYTNKILNQMKVYSILGIKQSLKKKIDYLGGLYGFEIEYKLKDSPIVLSTRFLQYQMDLNEYKYEENKLSLKIKYYF